MGLRSKQRTRGYEDVHNNETRDCEEEEDINQEQSTAVELTSELQIE